METTTMTTIDQFIAAHKVTMSVERTDRNPHMADSREMDHWRVMIKANGKRLSVVYSMGYGHHGKAPLLADVLDTLASDAASVAESAFADWAHDIGLSDDSIKARKTYVAIAKQAEGLLRMFGYEAYNELLYGVERR